MPTDRTVRLNSEEADHCDVDFVIACAQLHSCSRPQACRCGSSQSSLIVDAGRLFFMGGILGGPHSTSIFRIERRGSALFARPSTKTSDATRWKASSLCHRLQTSRKLSPKSRSILEDSATLCWTAWIFIIVGSSGVSLLTHS